ncbi:nitrous oxide reductase accessory protein NosL [Bacillus sp. 165]|uniref:nitrous oxide reductase accessory protein NosL n=1 Tax=Bacillus sp. 165 TaxID=1529117 RepID=UPI001AD9F04D|nr:nitrous oxide reductase accessory protein NosL [Bacillus sp. 165]MBO9129378.1 nitrous oxide reductase accessory protein NosL [Bacillus sp. 165]
MKWKGVLITLFTILVVAMAGCGKKEVKPVAIDEKNHTCAICNMAVMDSQFATEAILENGKVLTFDDIGCMYKWLSENEDNELQAKFVRDYNTKEWIAVDKATYVYDNDIQTPMAYNVISFKDKKDAESFISKHEGEVLMSEELENHQWEMNKEMMMKMKEQHGNMDMNHSH